MEGTSPPTLLRHCAGLLFIVACSSCGKPTITVQYQIVEEYSFSRSELSTIQTIANAAVTDVRPLLPGLPDELVLQLGVGDDVIPELGALATQANDTVYWTVDPQRNEGVEAIAKAHLRPALFHELHHMARGPIGLDSLMDLVISEGLATAFERDFAGAIYPWSEYPDDVSDWLAELLALPPSAPRNHWMFRHPDGRRWIGLRAGTYIVDRAITESGKSAAHLVATPTEDIIRVAQIEQP